VIYTALEKTLPSLLRLVYHIEFFLRTEINPNAGSGGQDIIIESVFNAPTFNPPEGDLVV